MREIEESIIELQVKEIIMPEIKALVPGLVGFILRAIFPKMESKLIEKIKELFEALLEGRK